MSTSSTVTSSPRAQLLLLLGLALSLSGCDMLNKAMGKKEPAPAVEEPAPVEAAPVEAPPVVAPVAAPEPTPAPTTAATTTDDQADADEDDADDKSADDKADDKSADDKSTDDKNADEARKPVATAKVSFTVRPNGAVAPKGELPKNAIWSGEMKVGDHVFNIRPTSGAQRQVHVDVKAGVTNTYCWDTKKEDWCSGR